MREELLRDPEFVLSQWDQFNRWLEPSIKNGVKVYLNDMDADSLPKLYRDVFLWTDPDERDGLDTITFELVGSGLKKWVMFCRRKDKPEEMNAILWFEKDGQYYQGCKVENVVVINTGTNRENGLPYFECDDGRGGVVAISPEGLMDTTSTSGHRAWIENN